MKAVIYTEYGEPEVLLLKETEKPLPNDNEVLIRIKAASVNYGDIIARNFKNLPVSEFNMPLLFHTLARLSFGLNRPKKQILGNTFAGEVEMSGRAVKLFKKGEAVFGYTGQNMGTYAQYLCIAEKDLIAGKPSNMTFDEASGVPYGAPMALCLLRKANIKPGQKVLILGASGGIGSAAVQLAKNYYEAEVTGVCGTQSTGFVKELGADKVIDYKMEDFTRNGETYDLIFDVLGKGTFSSFRNSLKENGIYLLASFKSRKIFQMLRTSLTGGKKKVVCAISSPKKEDLLIIKELIEEGKIKSVIDKTFPMEQAAGAHSYYETGNKNGHVVITF